MSQQYASHQEIAAEIVRLDLEVSHMNWRIGDLIIEALAMPDANGVKMTQARFRDEYLPNTSAGTVSRWVATAKAYTADDRAHAEKVGATWTDCSEARESFNSCHDNGTLENNESLRDHLDQCITKKHQTRSRRTESKERAERKRKDAEAARSVAVERIRATAPEYLQRVVHGDTIEAMRASAKGSFNLIWLDPPYGQYWKHKDKRCPTPMKGTPFLHECDNGDGEAALRVTLAAMQEAERLMADKSALVLFQAGSEPDRPEIVSLAADMGFEIRIPLYWDKGRPQPGNFECPFGYQTERILVFARSFDAFYDNGDMPGRTDVLDESLAERLYGEQRLPCPSPAIQHHHDIRQGKAEIGSMHQFTKPAWICRYFLERLTMPGDRVLDGFGCSGVMCQEAIALDRDFLYVESNTANYNLGLTNIERSLVDAGLIEPPPLRIIPKEQLRRSG